MNTTFPFKEPEHEKDNEELLTLSLSTGPRSSATSRFCLLQPTAATASFLPPPISLELLQPSAATASFLPPPISLELLQPSAATASFILPPTSLEPYPFLPILEGAAPSRPIQEGAGPSRPCRNRTSKTPVLRKVTPEKTDIPAPYPWATTRRATVHSLDYLLSNEIKVIRGEVRCKQCDKQYELEYDLVQKFKEVASYASENMSSMNDRAPAVWMNPTLPSCKFCQQTNCVKPVLSKKKSINWLFLLLGQMVGCCTLPLLKYFCKHNKNHRTAAKDRLVYSAYLSLCKQLDPEFKY